MLKDGRIRPQGWSAHAHELGVSPDIAILLREFACAGEPIFFIDGIDKITAPAVQLTVNDVLKAIANDEGLNVALYHAVTTFLKCGGIDLLPDPALGWLLGVSQETKADKEFWESNGENTVELLKLLIAKKWPALTPDHKKSIALVADILIDNGVRGAGFLQQELLRAA